MKPASSFLSSLMLATVSVSACLPARQSPAFPNTDSHLREGDATLEIQAQMERVEKLFARNAQLQAEGYFVAEFEFKIMSVIYAIDRMDMNGAREFLRIMEEQYANRTLPRIPARRPDQSEIQYAQVLLDFYRDCQYPDSGSFLDPAFPEFLGLEVTLNVISTMKELLERVNEGAPGQEKRKLVLKHPLRFLDSINSAPGFFTHQNRLVSVNPRIAGKLPKYLSVLLAGEGLIHDFQGVFAGPGAEPAFAPSQELEDAIYTWYRLNQDAVTGAWGPRVRANPSTENDNLADPEVYAHLPLLQADLSLTGNKLKLFLDKRTGTPLFPQDPNRQLSHLPRLVSFTLASFDRPYPDARPDQHSWEIDEARGFRLLTRELFPMLSNGDKSEIAIHAKKYVEGKFERNYFPKDGSFSFYAKDGNRNEGDLEGIGEFVGVFNHLGIGCVNPTLQICHTQEDLWPDFHEFEGGSLTFNSRRALADYVARTFRTRSDLTSFRVYRNDPSLQGPTPISARLVTEPVAVVSPERALAAEDFVLLHNKASRWVDAHPSPMGMWVSKASVQKLLSEMGIVKLPPQDLILETQLEGWLERSEAGRDSFLVGFDALQVPRLKLHLRATED